MTSAYQPGPDTSAYVDLRIYDRSDQEIFEAALAAAQLNLPEWTPLEGHTEVVLLEALALEMAEAVVAINRLPGAVLETLLKFTGVFKDYGAAPTATAQVVCADALGHDIPAGTRVYVPAADGSGVVIMLVQPPGVTIAPGSTTGTVTLIGDTFTDSANGVPASTSAQMASPLPFIERIVLTTPVADGRDPETDEAWRDRGVNRLSRLSDALVLPRHFEAAALENANVARVLAVDNTDPSSGAGTGNSPGHIVVAVLGPGGATLSTAAKAAIEQTLEDQAIAILDVHVTDITITTVNMTIQVSLSDSSSPAAIQSAVQQAVNNYLDPLTWAYGSKVRRNEIISLVDRVAGVDWVGAVTITGADSNGDFVMPTASSVPDAGTVTVTVVAS